MKYTSTFATYIEGLIEEKKALGYKYICETAILKRFDTFCNEYYPNSSTITQIIMNDWCKKRLDESLGTLQNRMTPVRELSKFMSRLGLETYIMPVGLMPRKQRYMPYIYSKEELQCFFAQTDKCHYCSSVPLRHLVMPVFFRLLYCSGMRLSEARLLKVRDIDLENGVITITNAKFNKHRQLPVSSEMLELLMTYNKSVHSFSSLDDYFFPGNKSKPMTRANVGKNFRKFLWKARISHGGRGKGPRIHDFRHTFSVHCLRRFVMDDKNLYTYLPVLQAYLGHVSLSDTAYYLRLTADLFPNITEKVESIFAYIVPTRGNDENN